MIQHARAGSTLARNSQVRVDGIELQLIGDFPKEFSFEMAQLRLDRPHELNRVGDKRLERLESVAQFRPSVGRIEQILESSLGPRRENHTNRRVAAGVWKSVERDIDAVVLVTLDFSDGVVDGFPRAASDENQMR